MKGVKLADFGIEFFKEDADIDEIHKREQRDGCGKSTSPLETVQTHETTQKWQVSLKSQAYH